MNATTPNSNVPHSAKQKRARRGVVIVAVLIVIVLLSLAGYQYADMATSEYKASENAHKQLQARAYAESGVHYAMALLGRPENIGTLTGSPFNNPGQFKDIDIKGPDGTPIGRFSIIGPPDANDALGAPLYGVICEAGKINLNAIMQVDPTGTTLFTMLKALPVDLNLTDDIINAIVDWLGGTMNSGAANSDYPSQSFSARAGPIDSIDELLLVKGMTREILYGTDVNRSGVPDTNSTSTYPRGLSTFITVHSREQYRFADPQAAYGKLPVWLNNTDLSQLYELLYQQMSSDELAKFMVLYRQYSVQKNGPTAQDVQGGKAAVGDITSVTLDFTKKSARTLDTIYTLLNSNAAYVVIPASGTNKVTYYYPNPLMDATKLADLLPKLFLYTTWKDDPTQKADRIPRININTAPREVLMTLTGITGVSLAESDVDNIIAARPQLAATDATPDGFETPAWLLAQSVISLSSLQSIEQFVTTSSQVYRVQAVGQAYEGKGPAVRVEAVVDLNAGRPRIVTWRDLSDLGKGWTQPAQ